MAYKLKEVTIRTSNSEEGTKMISEIWGDIASGKLPLLFDSGHMYKKAWEKVWREQKSGDIKRVFSEDYESTVPGEYTKDGKAHCYLYIAIQAFTSSGLRRTYLRGIRRYVQHKNSKSLMPKSSNISYMPSV